MNQSLSDKILKAHQVPKQLPGTKEVADFINRLLEFLFPELNGKRLRSELEVKTTFNQLRLDFEQLLFETKACEVLNADSICATFFNGIEAVYEDCIEDSNAILAGDPAAKDRQQVIRSYPGFYAIAIYRIAHLMCNLKVPYLPRILTEYAHSKTGVDIHPRAKIGKRFCIDHGTGIVIGETCVIGDDVKIYQGVTLGALSVHKSMAIMKRHPTIGNKVVIYSGATILGGETVIGEGSTIGGNVWLTSSVQPFTKIYYSAKYSQTVKMKSDNIGKLIGNTPLVKMNFPEIPSHVTWYGKLEGNNPAGSVKDRPAFYMINEALQRGDIHQKTKLIEATSGNTGVALAMVAASFGLDITLLMPATATKERVDTMKAYGAKVILTDANQSIEHSRAIADKMVAENGYFMLNQFENKDNYLAHYETTGPEIWRDTGGQVTHFVSSMGTTGTIMGNSMYLKEQNPLIKIIGVQPEEGSDIPGIRKWSPEFLPKIYNPKKVDQLLYVSTKDAKAMTKRLAREMGIFAGMSSGGAAHSTLKLAKTLREPAVIVSIICDRGDRYLSSDLFD
jgi:S-sulfo-L-cysteine synthase (O-acetyl-L-serine-dependent)